MPTVSRLPPFDHGHFQWETRLYGKVSHGRNLAFLGKVLPPTLKEAGPAFVTIVHSDLTAN